MRSLLLCVAGALLLAAPASAGGWATAGVAPPDAGVGAGETWNAVITIKQHGVTPLVGVEPSVIVSNGDDTLTFAARPTGKPGVYAAQVEFPSEGTWRYQVNDGFSRTHGFPPVQIGVGEGGGFSVPEWTWAVLLAALGLAAMYLLARRARAGEAPVAQQ